MENVSGRFDGLMRFAISAKDRAIDATTKTGRGLRDHLFNKPDEVQEPAPPTPEQPKIEEKPATPQKWWKPLLSSFAKAAAWSGGAYAITAISAIPILGWAPTVFMAIRAVLASIAAFKAALHTYDFVAKAGSTIQAMRGLQALLKYDPNGEAPAEIKDNTIEYLSWYAEKNINTDLGQKVKEVLTQFLTALGQENAEQLITEKAKERDEGWKMRGFKVLRWGTAASAGIGAGVMAYFSGSATLKRLHDSKAYLACADRFEQILYHAKPEAFAGKSILEVMSRPGFEINDASAFATHHGNITATLTRGDWANVIKDAKHGVFNAHGRSLIDSASSGGKILGSENPVLKGLFNGMKKVARTTHIAQPFNLGWQQTLSKWIGVGAVSALGMGEWAMGESKTTEKEGKDGGANPPTPISTKETESLPPLPPQPQESRESPNTSASASICEGSPEIQQTQTIQEEKSTSGLRGKFRGFASRTSERARVAKQSIRGLFGRRACAMPA